MKNKVDYRRHPRFLVPNEAIAALSASRLGRIKDISKGGLAFRYLPDEGVDDDAACELSEISIIHEPGFSLLNVPCKIIGNDCSLPTYPHGFLKLNTCRIQFCQLTPVQEAKLDFFIASFADGFSRKTN